MLVIGRTQSQHNQSRVDIVHLPGQLVISPANWSSLRPMARGGQCPAVVRLMDLLLVTQRHWKLFPSYRDIRFGAKVFKIGPKLDKSGTFSDQISVHFGGFIPFRANLIPLWESKCTGIWPEKFPNLSNLGLIWPSSAPNMTPLPSSSQIVWPTHNQSFIIK